MGDLIARLKSEGPAVWKQLSIVQRASLIVVALGAVAAIVFLGQWAQQPEYAPVLTKMSDGDSAAVVAKLKEMKVPFQLTDGGTTVLVPAELAQETRLTLASQGLPKGSSTGFELLDRSSFGLTDFAQKVNYQRALEGELARSISRISGVEEARVHLAIPQPQLFSDKEKPTTASIVLKLKPGQEPNGRQVTGIVNLVTKSVEGLKPENVTVVDGEGLTLSGEDYGNGMDGGKLTAQRDAQRGYESSIQRNVQAMLDQVLGARKAVVRVSAALDWDQYESNSETYSPAGKPAQVRSAREVSEKSPQQLADGQGAIPTYPLGSSVPTGQPNPGATPTTDGNGSSPQPTAAPQTPTMAASDSRYERKESTTNYELSKTVEHTVKAPGTVKRLSVSVLLDGSPDEALTGTISKAVTAAAGLDTSRGDTVIVGALPFDRAAVTAAEQTRGEAQQRDLILEGGKLGLGLLAMLVVALFVRSMIKGVTGGTPARQLAAAKPTIKEVRTRPAESRPALEPVDPRPMISQHEITELAKTQPKIVAGILKTWLDER